MIKYGLAVRKKRQFAYILRCRGKDSALKPCGPNDAGEALRSRSPGLGPTITMLSRPDFGRAPVPLVPTATYLK
jgi:hypothetical protein